MAAKGLALIVRDFLQRELLLRLGFTQLVLLRLAFVKLSFLFVLENLVFFFVGFCKFTVFGKLGFDLWG